MTKPEYDRVALIMANIRSPEVIDQIDKSLLDLRSEWEELLDLRRMAVRRHGSHGEPPAPPAPNQAEVIRPEPPVATDTGKDAGLTIGSLVERYLTDVRSPYHGTRHATRKMYDGAIKRIGDFYGNDQRLADMQPSDFVRIYENWSLKGHVAMAHSMVRMLRALNSFGANTLNDPDCVRLSIALHNMRFDTPKSQTEPMTADYADAIRKQARKNGYASMALAQALQFDCGLTQKEVIGEWVPQSEEPDQQSDISYDGKKWLRGVRWEYIDDNLILRHTASRTLEPIKLFLTEYTMVLDELDALAPGVADLALRGEGDARACLPATGPMIIDERYDMPWSDSEFRRIWRLMANEAGVPKGVTNRSSKAAAA